jgi:hypothetical protein
MKKEVRVLCLCLACVLLFSSCTGDRPAKRLDLAGLITEKDLPENQVQTQFLRDVYQESAALCPDTLSLRRGEVYYEEGLLACVVYDDVERQYQFVELHDGEIARKIPLPLEEGEHVNLATVRKEKTYYIAEHENDDMSETFRICVLNHADETVKCSDDFAGKLSPDWMGNIQIDDMTVDKNGVVVVMTNGDEVAVCQSGFSFYVLPVPHAWEVMTNPDGIAEVVTLWNGSFSLAAIDTGNNTLSESRPILEWERGEVPRSFCYDVNGVILCKDDNGICEIVNGEKTPRMRWMDSNCYPRDMTLYAAPSSDTLVLATQKNYRYVPALWEYVGDIDLSTIRVIEFANTVQMPTYAVSAVAAYNKANPTHRIVVTDYSFTGGADKLLFDITTGVYRPDVVLSKMGNNDLEYFQKHGMTLNLIPLMDGDDFLSVDNIFGCVRSAFSTDDNGMWAIPVTFTLSTIVAAPSAELSSAWELGELLDFAERLPANSLLMEGLTRENAADKLLGSSGFGKFFDEVAGICDFENPVFLRWLNWLLTLPANESDLSKTEFEQLDDGEKAHWYRMGNVTLLSLFINDVNAVLQPTFTFGSREWRLAEGVHSGEIESSAVFAVMNWEEEPVEIWKLIRECVVSDHSSGMSILKSRIEEKLAVAGDYDYTFYFSRNRGRGARLRDPDNPLTSDMLDETGEVLAYLPEDGERLMALLDTKVLPLANLLPDEVQKIITEELTSLFGDIGDAHNCARKIQSRVGIWLAEHK